VSDLRIKTRVESADNENIIESNRKCDFCKAKVSKYTCPKCKLQYCGIDCYKCLNHRKCSEDFYKDNVMREIKDLKSTDPDKKRIMGMLKRVMQSEDGADYVWNDNEAVENLAKRMEDIDLESASFDEMYCRLTEQEKKLFENVVQSGEVEIVDPCVPWWITKSNIELKKICEVKEIEEIKGELAEEAEETEEGDDDRDENGDEEDDEEESLVLDQDAPKLIKDIPPLNILLPNKRPSEKLQFSIIELLAIYCFIYRVYNAELRESLLEVLDSIIALSPVLTNNHCYENVETCIMSLMQRIKRSPEFKDYVDPIRVSLNDLNKIISSNFPTEHCKDNTPMSLLCISDLHNLFESGLHTIKGMKERTSEMKERKIFYHRITKKLLFMASWLSENSYVMKGNAGDIETLQRELLIYLDSMNEDKKLVEQHIQQLHGKKKLIEVL